MPGYGGLITNFEFLSCAERIHKKSGWFHKRSAHKKLWLFSCRTFAEIELDTPAERLQRCTASLWYVKIVSLPDIICKLIVRSPALYSLLSQKHRQPDVMTKYPSCNPNVKIPSVDDLNAYIEQQRYYGNNIHCYITITSQCHVVMHEYTCWSWSIVTP